MAFVRTKTQLSFHRMCVYCEEDSNIRVICSTHPMRLNAVPPHTHIHSRQYGNNALCFLVASLSSPRSLFGTERKNANMYSDCVWRTRQPRRRRPAQIYIWLLLHPRDCRRPYVGCLVLVVLVVLMCVCVCCLRVLHGEPANTISARSRHTVHYVQAQEQPASSLLLNSALIQPTTHTHDAPAERVKTLRVRVHRMCIYTVRIYVVYNILIGIYISECVCCR